MKKETAYQKYYKTNGNVNEIKAPTKPVRKPTKAVEEKKHQKQFLNYLSL